MIMPDSPSGAFSIWDIIPNNYTSIAKQFTMSYIDLNSRYKDYFRSTHELYLVSGLAYAYPYIYSASLITLEGYVDWFKDKNDNLYGFVITYEALLLSSIARSHSQSQRHLEYVVMKSDLIRRAVDKTLARGATKERYITFNSQFMHSDKWAVVRKQINIG